MICKHLKTLNDSIILSKKDDIKNIKNCKKNKLKKIHKKIKWDKAYFVKNIKSSDTTIACTCY